MPQTVLDTQELADELSAVDEAIGQLHQDSSAAQKQEVLELFDSAMTTITFMLRKVLGAWLAVPHFAMDYSNKVVFKKAVSYGLISLDDCVRWLTYCNGWRNDFYGSNVAVDLDESQVLVFIEEFARDAREIIKVIDSIPSDVIL